MEMLKEYFYYREICDDERMDRYFSRTIDIVRDKYKQMLRVESIEFDPLVSKYFEAEYITKFEGNTNDSKNFTGKLERHLGETDTNTDIGTVNYHTDGSVSASSEHSSENTERITDDGNISRQGSGTNSGYSTTDGQSNLTSNTKDSSNSITNGTDSSNKSIDTTSKAASKAAPMNASGVGTTSGGKLTGLDFEYASAYNQADTDTTEKNNGTNNSTTNNTGDSTTTDVGNNRSTTNNNGSSSSSETGTNSNVRVGTYGEKYHGEDGNMYEEKNETQHNIKNVLSKTGTNTDDTVNNEVRSGSENTNEVKHDRYAGRDGVLPQDAMASATHYLMNYSTAFQWLCNKLEPCFIGVYDI